MQSEPLATTNGSCHMSCDIVWLSDGGDLGVVRKQKPDHKIESPIGLP